MHVYCHFLNPFGKSEAKIWLFNLSYYDGTKQDNIWSYISIDILNFTITFEFLNKLGKQL